MLFEKFTKDSRVAGGKGRGGGSRRIAPDIWSIYTIYNPSMGATFTVDCHTAINSYFMPCSTVIRRVKQMAGRMGGGEEEGNIE